MDEQKIIVKAPVDCLQACLNVLRVVNPTLLASFPSYMTGLAHTQEKPVEGIAYTCVAEPTNKYDPNAHGIMSNNKRIAFMPRVMTEHVAKYYPNCVIVAFCTGHCTAKSAQCIYNVYSISCSVCQGRTNQFIFPCRHYPCCTQCFRTIRGQPCPTCKAPVMTVE